MAVFFLNLVSAVVGAAIHCQLMMLTQLLVCLKRGFEHPCLFASTRYQEATRACDLF